MLAGVPEAETKGDNKQCYIFMMTTARTTIAILANTEKSMPRSNHAGIVLALMTIVVGSPERRR
jgi:hypothetical protein